MQQRMTSYSKTKIGQREGLHRTILSNLINKCIKLTIKLKQFDIKHVYKRNNRYQEASSIQKLSYSLLNNIDQACIYIWC